jgi:MscS family membrane protein
MTFLRAIQKEDYERATEYLDSRLKLPERQELARKLGVIFDRKLSARLSALSDKPEGNLDDGLRPNRDLLGIIPSDSGNVDVLLDRVQRGKDRPIWLFSAESLQEVPRLYGELETWFGTIRSEQLARRLFSHPAVSVDRRTAGPL